jgi:hypothetical protein
MAITNPLNPYDDPNKAKKPAIAAPTFSRPALAGAPGMRPPAPAVASPASTQIKSSGSFARGLYDASAVAGDAMKAIPKGIVDGVNRTLVGVRNIAREGVGKAPVNPYEFNYRATRDKLAAERATNANPVASNPTNPTTPMTTAKPATVASPPTRALPQAQTPTPAIPALARPGDANTFTYSNGRTVEVDTSTPSIARPAVQITPTVPTFGTGGRVASTYGISAADANAWDAPAPSPSGRFRGPDAMADHHNSVEDREARQRLLSNLESERFRLEMIAGNPGRRGRAALAALGDNARQRAELAGQAEQLSAAAIQGRENRANAFGIAGLQDAGQSNRAANANATAERIAGMEDATKRTAIAAEIAKPHYDRDRQGNYMQITGTLARPVVDQDGNRIQGHLDEPAGQITPAMQYKALNEQLATLLDNPPVQAGPAYTQQVDGLRQRIASLIQPRVAVNPKTGQRMQYNPLTNGWEPIP